MNAVATAETSAVFQSSSRRLPRWIVALLLWLAAAGLFFGRFDRLPGSYTSEIEFHADTWFRESLTAPWTESVMIPSRFDQTLSVTPEVSLVQSHMHWKLPTGEITYASEGLYGVDRRSRENVGDYGTVKREGQFLFAPGVERKRYALWDPFYSGPRQCVFLREEESDGLKLYVFSSEARDLLENEAYATLPDVPERFSVNSRGRGELRVEPVSGVVVDYDDEGTSYFIDARTMEPAGDFYWWKARYLPETRARQVRLAREGRLWLQARHLWGPLALLSAGLLLVAVKPRAKSGFLKGDTL